MNITVRKNAFSEPMLSTNEATWAEIRDEQGWLILVIIFPPGKATCLVIDKQDPEFAETVKNFGIEVRKIPG